MIIQCGYVITHKFPIASLLIISGESQSYSSGNHVTMIQLLTHWGRVTHIRVSNLTIIFQITTCRLVGAEPLSEPMLEYC